MPETDWGSKFLEVYANLPAGERGKIVAVVDNEPYTWNSAMIEIKQETPKGKKILEVLKDLKILI